MSAPAINKLEDSATGRALAAVVQGSSVLVTFVDFTSNLIRNVFTTLTETSMDQLEAYADLVAKVSGTVADFEARTLGDIDAAALKFLNEVVLPQFMDQYPADAKLDDATVNDPVPLDLTKLEDFKALFSGVTANNHGIEDPTVITGAPATPAISKQSLKDFAKAKLQRGIQKSYDTIVAILKIGMQKIVVTEGNIHTKLTFHVDAKDTDETSAEATTRTNTANKSFNWGVKATKGIPTGLASQVIAKSIAQAISGGTAGMTSGTETKVNVANEKHTSQTTIGVDILGEVSVSFRSDFFPSFDPTQNP